VSDFDDPPDAMTRFPTADDAERILTGAEPPADPLARLVAAMRSPATPAERAGSAGAVATIAGTVIAAQTSLTPNRRSRMLTPALSAKAAAIAVATLLAAGTAAAATGNLPDSAQQTVSDTLSHVGVSVPNPHADVNEPDGATGKGPESAPGKGPDATGSAAYGLCTAYANREESTNPHTKRDDAVAFRNLAKAAADADKTVAELCADVTARPSDEETTTTSGERDKPGSLPAGVGNGHGNPPSSVPAGPPSSTPPVSTPHGPPDSTPQGPPDSTPPVSTPHSTGRP